MKKFILLILIVLIIIPLLIVAYINSAKVSSDNTLINTSQKTSKVNQSVNTPVGKEEVTNTPDVNPTDTNSATKALENTESPNPINTMTSKPDVTVTPKPTVKPTPKPTPEFDTVEKYQEDLVKNINEATIQGSWSVYVEDNSYAKYKMEHFELSWERVILLVNMGYNYPPYTRMLRFNNSPKVLAHSMNKYCYSPTDFTRWGLPQLDASYGLNDKVFDIDESVKPYLENLILDARKAGHTVKIIRCILKITQQEELYNSKVKELGQETADKYFFKPRHTEYQTGDTVALNSDNINDWVKGGINYNLRLWLEQNAYKYGFVIRYSKGDPKITGYEHSYWDIKYVGMDKALEFKNYEYSYEEFDFPQSGWTEDIIALFTKGYEHLL